MLPLRYPEAGLMHTEDRLGQRLRSNVEVRQDQDPRSGVPVPQGGLVLGQGTGQPRHLRATQNGLTERKNILRLNPPTRPRMPSLVRDESLHELAPRQAHSRVERHMQDRWLHHCIDAEANDDGQRPSRCARQHQGPRPALGLPSIAHEGPDSPGRRHPSALTPAPAPGRPLHQESRPDPRRSHVGRARPPGSAPPLCTPQRQQPVRARHPHGGWRTLLDKAPPGCSHRDTGSLSEQPLNATALYTRSHYQKPLAPAWLNEIHRARLFVLP